MRGERSASQWPILGAIESLKHGAAVVELAAEES
jgi:hypothetical protein